MSPHYHSSKDEHCRDEQQRQESQELKIPTPSITLRSQCDRTVLCPSATPLVRRLMDGIMFRDDMVMVVMFGSILIC